MDLRNCDNMELMAEFEDNHFDLAIVDPPYGIGEGKKSRGMGTCAMAGDYKIKDWDKSPPSEDYFKELIRVSKNQIIWGANHFISRIPYDSSCWIVWDKDNGSSDFADAELAWTSFRTAVRIIKYRWVGMLQQNMKNKETRIHPTQKPAGLYKWILQNYAKEGDKILDTHLGSGSIACACHELHFDLTGCELDQEYYNAMLKRLDEHTAQQSLF